MREWKYVSNGLVHDVETWSEARRLRTPRCDVADRIYALSFTEHATTCITCVSIRGSYISHPLDVEKPAGPSYFDISKVFAPADRSGMVLNRWGRYGS